MKKDFDSTKKLSRPSKEEIKKQWMESLVCNENIINTENLNERADRVERLWRCYEYYKRIKDIIKTNKQNIIFFAYQQGNVFRKFKENRKFKNLVERFKITKGTIIFTINTVKLIDKYPKMLTSSITLNFLKSYYKDIKNICKENQEVFK